MKTIGLLGGTSWPSTPLYLNLLNELVQTRLGGHHSAELVVRYGDYDPIKSLYGVSDGWSKIPQLLKARLDALVALKPDGLILCNNTLHKALDMLCYEESCGIPVFHAVKETGRAMQKDGIKSALILATPLTMEDGFFARGLEAFGITSMIPNATERKRVGEVQALLAKGTNEPEYTAFFASLAAQTKADAVILACTELPLALKPEDIQKPLYNSIVCQCRAAVDFALA